MMITRRVCAWCGTTLGLYMTLTMKHASHGICSPCAATWKATYLKVRS